MATILSALRTTTTLLLRPRRLSGSQVPPPLPPKPAPTATTARRRAFTLSLSPVPGSPRVADAAPKPPRTISRPRAFTGALPKREVEKAVVASSEPRTKASLPLRLRRLTIRRKGSHRRAGSRIAAKEVQGLKREKTMKRLRGMGVFVTTHVEEIYEQALVPFTPSPAGPSSATGYSSRPLPKLPKRASTIGPSHSRKPSVLTGAAASKHGRMVSTSSFTPATGTAVKPDRRGSLGIGTKRFSNMVNRRTSQQLIGALNLLELAAPSSSAPSAGLAQPSPAAPGSPPVLVVSPTAALVTAARTSVELQQVSAPPSSFVNPSRALGSEEEGAPRAASLALSDAGLQRLLALETRAASRMGMSTQSSLASLPVSASLPKSLQPHARTHMHSNRTFTA